jgi:phage replication O-like protein O
MERKGEELSMTVIKAPNYTQIPNVFFDEYMKNLSGSEYKIMCAIARKTFGWHKEYDRISYSQISEITGISSKETINKALKILLEKNYIIAIKNNQCIKYAINITESEPVQKMNRYGNCTNTGTGTVPAEQKTGTEIVHTKEILNKNKEIEKQIRERERENLFLIFYQNYPKKVDKSDAIKVFNTLIKKGIKLDYILSKLKIYEKQIKQNNTELKYIRSPARFLRTMDDYEDTEVKKRNIIKQYCKKCGEILLDGTCSKCYALHDIEGELI